MQIGFAIDANYFLQSNILWRDILWAYKNHLASRETILKYAKYRFDAESEPSNELTEVALHTPENDLHFSERLQSIVTSEEKHLHPTPDEESEKKFLKITLLCLYENRDSYDDPLGMIECIYADFDYPEEIEQLVRYMPAKRSNPSVEKMYQDWASYVGKA